MTVVQPNLVSFDYQFYLYQESDAFVKMMVAVTMGAVLLVLCVKLFCCRKSPSHLPVVGPQDSDDGDDTKLTSTRVRVRPSYQDEPAQASKKTEIAIMDAEPREREDADDDEEQKLD